MKKTFRFKPIRLLLTALAVTGSAFAQTYTPLPDPLPAPIQSTVTVGLQEVASGFVVPVWGTYAPGDDDHLFVVDAIGKIWMVNISPHETPGMRLFLDISSQIVPLGVFKGYDERGLLGLAFHPDFRRNGLFYTFSSQPVNGKADFSTVPPGTAPNCQSVITEWRVMRHGDGDWDDDDNQPPTIDMSSARELMRIDKPEFNHNGGTLVFGPDHMLYFGLGDGGNANDAGSGHIPGGNAQSLTPGNVLGKILRIDPLGHNSANGKYGIPWDNPFVRNSSAQPEVWAYGLRNPFRMSFDSRTGMLWAADVGQNTIEEVDVIHKGGNYGWPVKEGSFLFSVDSTGNGFVYANSPGSPSGLIDPIAEYDHFDNGISERIAIVGGFVYRGREVHELRGHYVFGDYAAQFLAPNGHIFWLNGIDHHIEYLQVQGQTGPNIAVEGFGEDARGEVYLMGNTTGGFLGTTGKVLRLISAN